MNHRKRMLLTASLAVFLGGIGGRALSSNTEPPNKPSANCSDYRLMPSPAERGPIDLQCNAKHASEQQALWEAIDRLDPVAEARIAAQRYDFRLAAIVGEAVHARGSYISSRFWTVEGVECKSLDNKDVVIWLPISDAFVDEAQIRLQARMLELRRAYNVALVTEAGFPRTRGCKPLQG